MPSYWVNGQYIYTPYQQLNWPQPTSAAAWDWQTTASTTPMLYGTGYNTNQYVWQSWTTGTTSAVVWPQNTVNVYGSQPVSRRVLTEAELAVQRRHDALIRRRGDASAMRARVAERRAKALLMECLTPEQREDYERLQRFELILPSGNRYRLRRGLAGNIDRLDENGRVLERLCVHVPHGYPHSDNVLTQKLALELDEENVRRLANIERFAA